MKRICVVCETELNSSEIDTMMSNEFDTYCIWCGQQAYYAGMALKSAMWADEERHAYNYGLDD